MNKAKMSMWMWQFAVYDPINKCVDRLPDGGYTIIGPSYPYRDGNFNMKWFKPFHPGRPEYWDKNYVKPVL